MSRSPAVVASLRRRRRASLLASTERAGTHSRHIIRQHQQKRIRERWYVFAGIIAVAGLVCLLISYAVRQPFDAYLIGAIGASTIWACHSLLTATDGLAGRRAGIFGEEWTAMELRKLRRRGWRFVNHVMLEHGDVDHAVLGPGGFFAMDSKWRADWSESIDSLGGLAKSCRYQAGRLHLRLGRQMPAVKPVVVMWGPNLADVYAGAFKLDGVTFCPGHLLADHLRGLPDCIRSETLEQAFDSLGRYVENRDIGERKKLGASLRSFSDHFNDLLFATLAALASAFAILLPARIEPQVAWSVAVATAITGMAFALRRRSPSSGRVARVTTAIIATAAGMGALLAAGLVIVGLG